MPSFVDLTYPRLCAATRCTGGLIPPCDVRAG